MASPAATIGQVIDRRYAVERPLKEGQFGSVLEARDLRLDRRVLLKIAAGAEPENAQRLIREAQVLSRLRSPHVAMLYDSGTLEDGRAFLVTELVEGISLESLLSESGPLPIDTALTIAEQIASALAEAHRVGLVHRDLKPDNIIVAGEPAAPGTLVVRLVDFGVAGLLRKKTGMTAIGQIFGTPAYMAPEQVMGREQSPATDVYALGLVLYEMLTGQRPFHSDDAFQLVMQAVSAPVPPPPASLQLPAGLVRFVERCLSKESGDRPADGEAALIEIRRLRHGDSTAEEMPAASMAGEDIAMRPASPKVPASAPSVSAATRRTSRLTVVLVVAGAVLVLAAVPLLWALIHGVPPTQPDRSTPGAPPSTQTGNAPTNRPTPHPGGLVIEPAGIVLGVTLVIGGIVLGSLTQRWLMGRQRLAQQSAVAVLAGSRSREQLNETLAIEIDALIEQVHRLDERIMARTVALMLHEYQSAKAADDRRNALVKSVELLEKLTSRMTPWYVRWEKVLVFFVTGVGLASGLVSLVKSLHFPGP